MDAPGQICPNCKAEASTPTPFCAECGTSLRTGPNAPSSWLGRAFKTPFRRTLLPVAILLVLGLGPVPFGAVLAPLWLIGAVPVAANFAMRDQPEVASEIVKGVLFGLGLAVLVFSLGEGLFGGFFFF